MVEPIPEGVRLADGAENHHRQKHGKSPTKADRLRWASAYEACAIELRRRAEASPVTSPPKKTTRRAKR